MSDYYGTERRISFSCDIVAGDALAALRDKLLVTAKPEVRLTTPDGKVYEGALVSFDAESGTVACDLREVKNEDGEK